MSETEEPQAGGAPQPEGAEEMSAEEAELRRRIEQQMREIRVQDLLLESLAGILSLTARRIEKEDERDLAQARLGIDAARAVVDLLDPEPAAQVRSALAELQMRFARVAGDGGGGEAPPEGPPKGPSPLWTPGRGG